LKHVHYTCDSCNAPLPPEYDHDKDKIRVTIRYVVGAVEQEEEFYERDLCHRCLAKAINKYFGRTKDFEAAKKFLSSFDVKK